MSENMNEFCIDWTRGAKTAGVTLPNATAMKSRVMKLAEKHPDEVKILATNPDGSIFARVPTKCVAIRWPREVSPEQAAAASERFKKMWEERGEESELEFDDEEEEETD